MPQCGLQFPEQRILCFPVNALLWLQVTRHLFDIRRFSELGHKPGISTRHTLPKGYKGTAKGLHLDWGQRIFIGGISTGPVRDIEYQTGHSDEKQPKGLQQTALHI